MEGTARTAVLRHGGISLGGGKAALSPRTVCIYKYGVLAGRWQA
jgi:hypothetical protein